MMIRTEKYLGVLALLLSYYPLVHPQQKECPDMSQFNCVENGKQSESDAKCAPCEVPKDAAFNAITDQCILDVKNMSGSCPDVQQRSQDFQKGDGTVAFFLKIKILELDTKTLTVTLKAGGEVGLKLDISTLSPNPPPAARGSTPTGEVGKGSTPAAAAGGDPTKGSKKDGKGPKKDDDAKKDGKGPKKDGKGPKKDDGDDAKKDGKGPKKDGKEPKKDGKGPKKDDGDDAKKDDGDDAKKDDGDDAKKDGKGPKKDDGDDAKKDDGDDAKKDEANEEKDGGADGEAARKKRGAGDGMSSRPMIITMETDSKFTYEIKSAALLAPIEGTGLDIRISYLTNNSTSIFVATVGDKIKIVSPELSKATVEITFDSMEAVCKAKDGGSNETSGECGGVFNIPPRLARLSLPDFPRSKTVHGTFCISGCQLKKNKQFFFCQTKWWRTNDRWLDWDLCSPPANGTTTAHGYECKAGAPCEEKDGAFFCDVDVDKPSISGYNSTILCNGIPDCGNPRDYCVKQTEKKENPQLKKIGDYTPKN